MSAYYDVRHSSVQSRRSRPESQSFGTTRRKISFIAGDGQAHMPKSGLPADRLLTTNVDRSTVGSSAAAIYTVLIYSAQSRRDDDATLFGWCQVVTAPELAKPPDLSSSNAAECPLLQHSAHTVRTVLPRRYIWDPIFKDLVLVLKLRESRSWYESWTLESWSARLHLKNVLSLFNRSMNLLA